jgi:hypothetical protein
MAIGTHSNTSADPEDIRFNPKKQTLWFGQRRRCDYWDKQVLQNPSLNFMDLKGNFLNTFTCQKI